MSWQRFFIKQLKVTIYDKSTILFVVIGIFIGLFAAYLESEKQVDRFSVAIVNQDEGLLGESLAKDIMSEDWMQTTQCDYAKASRLLESDKIEGIILIKKQFTNQIVKGRFDDCLEITVTPSSRATSALSEPAINKTIKLWSKEKMIQYICFYWDQERTSYDEKVLENVREQIEESWENGGKIDVVVKYTDKKSNRSSNPLTRGMEGSNEGFSVAIIWYSIFAFFYVFISMKWMIEMDHQSLYKRITQNGISSSKIKQLTGLIPCIIGGFGFQTILLLFAFQKKMSIQTSLKANGYIFLFLFGIYGIVLLFSLLVKELVVLFYSSLLMTFVHAVLSELFSPLPVYAQFLNKVSICLPGYWLKEGMAGNAVFIQSSLCSLAWITIGLVLTGRRFSKK